MRNVFISYSRADSLIVDDLVVRLNQAGYRVWLDRNDIYAGRQWRSELAHAIRGCNIFILVLSPNSARSREVAKELTLAEESSRAVIPVEIAELKIPSHLEYHLAGTHRLSLKDGLDAGFPRLLEAMAGAPERAEASSARFDRVLSENDAEMTGVIWDANEIDAQRSHLLQELFRLDEVDARHGHADPDNADRRNHILKQLDELTVRRGQKMTEAQRLQSDSHRQIAELAGRKKNIPTFE